MADEKLFKAITKASVSLTELLPYLNAVTEKANYLVNSKSLIFRKGIIGFTLQETNINITRFANMTELYEILDWIKELINTTYENRESIVPDYKTREITPVINIYKLLPKKNCKKCGEQTCMAFAAKLSKFETEIDNCPLLKQDEFTELRHQLINEME